MRDKRIDNIKSILIFLVVFTHFLYSYTFYNNKLVSTITFIIYSFHMPLFSLLSGYLTKKTINKKKLFEYFIIFVILDLSFVIYNKCMNLSSTLINYSSWYLLYLIIWRIIYNKINEKNIKKLSVICFISSLFLPLFRQTGNISRFFYLFSFFLIGTNYDFNKANIKKKTSILLIVIYLLLIAQIIIIYPFNYTFFLGGVYQNYIEIVFKIIFFIASLVILFNLYNIIPNKRITILTKVGQNSLYVYIYHRIITLIINYYYFYDNSFYIFLSIILSILLCIVFGTNTVKNLTNKITNWILFILQKPIISVLIVSLGLTFYYVYSENVNENVKKTSFITESKINKIKKNSIEIGYVGDLILLEDEVKSGYKDNKYNYDYMFKYTKKYFESSDLMIGVLEGPSDDKKKYSTGNFDDNKDLVLNFPHEFLDSIKNSSIDFVTTANNHLLDSGINSAYSTIDYLDKIDLKHTGSYKNKKENIPFILNIKGVKIGVLSYTYGANNISEDLLFSKYKNLSNYLCDTDSKYLKTVRKNIKDDFNYLRNKVDVIIVMPHMGEQFSHEENNYQRYWNNYFMHLGADIILGDHSHTTQNIYYKNNTLVVNSPGNYVNSYIEYDGDLSYITKIYIDKKTNKVNMTSVIPLYAYKQMNNLYTAIPIYDIFNDKEIYNKMTLNDIKRAKEGAKIITKTSINKELPYYNLSEENYYYNNEYKKNYNKKITITEQEKKKETYKKIDKSDTTCFIGDSITEGSLNDYYPWYLPLMNNFNNKVVNISKTKYTSIDIVKNYEEKIKNSKCDLFIINVGINDIHSNISVNDYIKNIDKIVSFTNKNVILMFPWRSLETRYKNNKQYKYYGKIHDKFDKEIEKYSQKNNLLYINPNKYIRKELDNNIESDYYVDCTHPNSLLGIELYSKAIVENFK